MENCIFTLFSEDNIEVIDLSAPLGTKTYCHPDDPQFKKSWHIQMPQNAANVSKIETGLHTGTHVDAPLHFINGGADVSMLPLASFFGPAIAINAPKKPGEDISVSDIENQDIREGDIVLFHTGWGTRINTPHYYDPQWPGFSVDVLKLLISMKVKAIGFDSPAADNAQGPANNFPAHKTALGAGLIIYESVCNLNKVTGKRFIFVGLPLCIEEGEGSLVRAMAIIPKQ